ncbi:hypothetical protein LCGC14_2107770 [marine sediment metagenome]|uniref:Uncharacterized protein n=1 Tax=marine sediment metagenome TaxID=412755 RepID=A0A0F9H4A1_9ZZZZ
MLVKKIGPVLIKSSLVDLYFVFPDRYNERKSHNKIINLGKRFRFD